MRLVSRSRLGMWSLAAVLSVSSLSLLTSNHALSHSALVAAASATVAPNAASAAPAALPALVAHDGQRLSGELYVSSLRVPANVTLWADDGLRLTSMTKIQIEGTLRSSRRAPAGLGASGDIVLFAAEGIEIAATGLVLGADGRADTSLEGSGERGASVLLAAPQQWIDGIVRGGDGASGARGARGGAGGSVFVYGNAWSTRMDPALEAGADAPSSGLFGGRGGAGGSGAIGGAGGHALALGLDPTSVARALGIDLQLEELAKGRLEFPVAAATGSSTRAGASWMFGSDDDDAVPCGKGVDGVKGVNATGADGGPGGNGPDAPHGSGFNGGDGAAGGPGGHATASNGANGADGTNCCPNAGGAGGNGGNGGDAKAGKGGPGGAGGMGDGAGFGGCGGNGGPGANAGAGWGGFGGNGGARFGAGGAKGLKGTATKGLGGGYGPNGGPVNPACAPQRGANGGVLNAYDGSPGQTGPDC